MHASALRCGAEPIRAGLTKLPPVVRELGSEVLGDAWHVAESRASTQGVIYFLADADSTVTVIKYSRERDGSPAQAEPGWGVRVS